MDPDGGDKEYMIFIESAHLDLSPEVFSPIEILSCFEQIGITRTHLKYKVEEKLKVQAHPNAKHCWSCHGPDLTHTLNQSKYIQ